MDDCTYYISYGNEHNVEVRTPEIFDKELALKVANHWAENGTVRNVRLVTVRPIGIQE